MPCEASEVGDCSIVSASISRYFGQWAALRSVASISQESLPGTSGHALRRHRLRAAAAARLVRLTPACFPQAHVPRSRVWWSQAAPVEEKRASAVFAGFFGKQSAGNLPTETSAAPQKEAESEDNAGVRARLESDAWGDPWGVFVS